MGFIPIHDTNPLRNITRPYVAWTLIAANVVIFLASGGYGGGPGEVPVLAFGLIPAVFNNLAPTPVAVAVPDALTLITYSFLHGDVWHLAGNMVFLWVLADNVEDALGHIRYLAFYLICAMVAGYAYVLTEPTSHSPVIGASGAVAGNIAAYLMLHPRAKMWVLVFARIPIRLSALYVLGIWVAFQLFALIGGGGEEIAWWSHVGGLVAGAVLIVFLRKRGVTLFDRGAPRTAPAAGPPSPPLPPAPDGGPWR